MIYPTVRVVFDRKKVASDSVTGLIQVEVSYKRKRKFISTGVKVYATQWGRNGSVINRPDMLVLNRRIGETTASIEKYLLGLAEKETPFSFDALNEWLYRSDERSMTFPEWVENCIDERKDIRPGTKRNHLKIVALLGKMPWIKNFSDLTHTNILRMDAYLHSKGIRQTTIASYHKFMKIYVHRAMACDLLEKDPYLGIKIEIGKSVWGRFLTADEVATIERTEMPTESLGKVKDMFLFQCYTGLAYSDLMRFDFSKAKMGKEYYVLTDDRKKTGEGYAIVLLPKAMEILGRHEMKIPQMSCEQYNMRLKVMADMCGIDKPIASHYGRRTCGMLLLNEGFPIEVVAKVLGHSTIRTTQAAYAKLLDMTVESEYIKRKGCL